MSDEDVIRVNDTPANLTANLKDKMFSWDITNNRFGAKIAGGIMKWISEDAKQMLLATVQTVTGLKTFQQFTAFLDGISIAKTLSIAPLRVHVAGDNELVDVSNNSMVFMTTGTTITPANHSIGFTAGLYDGQICHIVLEALDDVEIVDTISPFTDVLNNTGGTPPFNKTAPFKMVWDSARSLWQII